MNEAVQTSIAAWGENSLTELEAEDKLSYACEKVSENSTFYTTKRMLCALGNR